LASLATFLMLGNAFLVLESAWNAMAQNTAISDGFVIPLSRCSISTNELFTIKKLKPLSSTTSLPSYSTSIFSSIYSPPHLRPYSINDYRFHFRTLLRKLFQNNLKIRLPDEQETGFL